MLSPLFTRDCFEVVSLHMVLSGVVLLGCAAQWLQGGSLPGKVVKRAITNTTFGTLVHAVAVYLKGSPVTEATLEISRWKELLSKWVLAYVFADVMYYTIHRTLHSKWMYRRIHYIHHEAKEEGHLSSLNVHPVEYAVAQLGTELVSSWVVGAKLVDMWLMSAGAMAFGMYSHSQGFEASVSVMSHAEHHRKGNRNLGVTGMMDWLLGSI